MNLKHGILHHHDFPQDQDHKILPGWRDHIPLVADKFSALAKRFAERLGDAKEAAFFVRWSTHQ